MYTTVLFYHGFNLKLQFSFYLEQKSKKEDGKQDFVSFFFFEMIMHFFSNENFDHNIHIETELFE